MSSADDVKMSENPVPETLESIAARIEALNQRFDGVDQRFTTVDQRFTTVDQQMVEMKAHLGIKIEAVDVKVAKVFDEVIAMREEAKRNAKEHRTFTKRLDDHDVRILALEKPAPPKP
jgi:hypothetical protein